MGARGTRDAARFQIVVNHSLGVPVPRVRVLRVIKRGPDEVLHPSGIRCVNEILPLANLFLFRRDSFPDCANGYHQ